MKIAWVGSYMHGDGDDAIYTVVTVIHLGFHDQSFLPHKCPLSVQCN